MKTSTHAPSRKASSHKAPVLPSKASLAAQPSKRAKASARPNSAQSGATSAPQPSPQDQTREDVQAEKDQLSARIDSLRDHLTQNPTHGILIRQREAMIALESILDERLRTGELE